MLSCLTVSEPDVYFVSRKCDVVNRGLSGYNSRWAKILLPRLIDGCQSSADNNISAVTVFFGSNDCALEGTIHRNTEYIHSRLNVLVPVAVFYQ